VSGRASSIKFRVYYEDTDAAGIVYYANYLKFAERGRTELLRSLGFDHVHLREQHDLVFVVRRCTADYRRPARLDDELEVVTAVSSIRGARLAMSQSIRHRGEELVLVEVELAVLSTNLLPRRLPPAVAARLRSG